MPHQMQFRLFQPELRRRGYRPSPSFIADLFADGGDGILQFQDGTPALTSAQWTELDTALAKAPNPAPAPASSAARPRRARWPHRRRRPARRPGRGRARELRASGARGGRPGRRCGEGTGPARSRARPAPSDRRGRAVRSGRHHGPLTPAYLRGVPTVEAELSDGSTGPDRWMRTASTSPVLVALSYAEGAACLVTEDPDGHLTRLRIPGEAFLRLTDGAERMLATSRARCDASSVRMNEFWRGTGARSSGGSFVGRRRWPVIRSPGRSVAFGERLAQ